MKRSDARGSNSRDATRSNSLLLLIVALLMCGSHWVVVVVVEGFTTTPASRTSITTNIRPSIDQLSYNRQYHNHNGPHPTNAIVLFASSSSNPEVEALLAAAAKAREEANRLSEELGKPTTSQNPSTTTTTSTTRPMRSVDEVKAMIPTILSENDIQKQKEQWEALKSTSTSSSSSSSSSNAVLRAFGSANLRTFPVSLSMLEQRTGLTAATLGLTDSDVSLDDFKYATLYVTGGSTIAAIASLAFLPPNVGATLCYGFALIPILFLGIGSTAPGFIAEAIATVRGGDKVTDGSIITKQERICRHEAAHFCCGYWCGLPIVNYNTLDISNTNVARVEFDIASGSSTGYTPTEVAALTVTAMAGLAGESMQYGSANGATEDLLLLENNVFRKSQNFIGAAASQDLTRWGALTASLLLKQNTNQYEAVVAAFQRQASIDECIAILENLS